jgi:N-acetylglucosamine kinase-like BadF-type ATPase
VDFPIDAELLSGVPEASGLTGPSAIVNDSFVALRAGTEAPFGVVVVAGTGSVVAGRNPAGEVFRTLGLGPTFGDWGSASEISAAGVTAVADAHLGRGPETMLTALVCERTGVASAVEFLEATGRGRIDDTRFAPLVARAARLGDAAARRILVMSGERLGANAAHVIRMLGMADLALEVVVAGGVFRSGSLELLDALEETVRATAAAARLVPLEAPPVVGSLLMAAESADLPLPPGFRDALVDEVTAALGIVGEELRSG